MGEGGVFGLVCCVRERQRERERGGEMRSRERKERERGAERGSLLRESKKRETSFQAFAQRGGWKKNQGRREVLFFF